MSTESKPTRRHPNVINLSEAAERSQEKGTRFGFSGRMLAQATGGKGIGCSHYEVPPGRAAFPAHYHCANEEALYVLEGQGTVRIGTERFPVGPGDYVTFPIGPDNAHQVINTGTVPLRYLALSTRHTVEVVGYPDSKKIGAMAAGETWKFGEPPWVRAIVREGANLDYYDGEQTE
jgi:uncharacterized cupin superfamily protein